MIKRFLLIASVVILGTFTLAQPGLAKRLPSFTKTYNSHVVHGKVLDSYAVYRKGQPTTRQVCKNVKVPVYAGATPADQTGNIVAGAIIGGILGKAVTGNDRGAAAGAVIGGVAGANQNKPRITGYRYEQQCTTVTKAKAKKIKFYEARVRIEGRIYLVRTTYQLAIGDKVRMFMPN